MTDPARPDRLRELIAKADDWLRYANGEFGWGNMPAVPKQLVQALRDELEAAVSAPGRPEMCATCKGLRFVMRSMHRDLGGDLSSGASWNEPCPDCGSALKVAQQQEDWHCLLCGNPASGWHHSTIRGCFKAAAIPQEPDFTRLFLQTLRGFDWLSAPEVLLEDDDDIGFDWYVNGHTVSASVSATGRAGWAALINGESSRGTFQFPEWPDAFTDTLKRLEAPPPAAGRGALPEEPANDLLARLREAVRFYADYQHSISRACVPLMCEAIEALTSPAAALSQPQPEKLSGALPEEPEIGSVEHHLRRLETLAKIRSAEDITERIGMLRAALSQPTPPPQTEDQ